MKRARRLSGLPGRNKGYALLTAILAVAIFAVMMMKARTLWETELLRDLEQELIFRGNQYVTAIELFRKKNINQFPQSLEELYEKNFLRRPFKDPMTKEGKWNVVMQSGTAGKKLALLVVPEDMVAAYISRAGIIGVCSTSCEEGFRVYRKKKKYCEWAFYLGQQVDKEMPELKYVAQGEGEDELQEKSQPDTGSERENGREDNDER
jgi:type II secretory pathway pseudopilin PulG